MALRPIFFSFYNLAEKAVNRTVILAIFLKIKQFYSKSFFKEKTMSSNCRPKLAFNKVFSKYLKVDYNNISKIVNSYTNML